MYNTKITHKKLKRLTFEAREKKTKNRKNIKKYGSRMDCLLILRCSKVVGCSVVVNADEHYKKI